MGRPRNLQDPEIGQVEEGSFHNTFQRVAVKVATVRCVRITHEWIEWKVQFRPTVLPVTMLSRRGQQGSPKAGCYLAEAL